METRSASRPAIWIDLDVRGELEPQHRGGDVEKVPGLYFFGLMFLYAGSSVMVHGVSRDPSRLADEIVSRARLPNADCCVDE